MTTAHVQSADRLGQMPDQDVGTHPVIRVTTDLPFGSKNSFYMETVDLSGVPIKLPLANQSADAPVDPEAINRGDLILFDMQDGFHKRVSWNGRGIRQKGYSFDIGPQRP